MANTKLLLGFIAGASIGTIAGILLAPDSGANTRKKIAEKSGDLKDTIADSVSGWLDKLQKVADEEIKSEHHDANTQMGSEL